MDSVPTCVRVIRTRLSLSAFACAVAASCIGMAACGTGGAVEARPIEAGGDAPSEGEAAAATGTGVLTFTQSPDGGGTFYAAFSESPLPAATGCTFVDAGDCTTATCKPAAAPEAGTTADAAPDATADATAAVAPNPGVLNVRGGVFGSLRELGPDRLGTYVYTSLGPLFAAGDSLGVSAQGAALPAFPEQTLVAPAALGLTAPPTAAGKTTIVTSQPLRVAWTPGRKGDFAVLTASAVFTSGGVASMTCTWDAAAGAATVPMEALAPLATQNALTAGLLWYEEARRTFTVGPVAVTMSAVVPQQSAAAFQ